MKKVYEEMMAWALGEGYSHRKVSDTPEFWKNLHPELPELDSMPEDNCIKNLSYWTFQMTLAWALSYTIPSEVPASNEKHTESQNNESIKDIFAVIWSDIKKMFRKK